MICLLSCVLSAKAKLLHKPYNLAFRYCVRKSFFFSLWFWKFCRLMLLEHFCRHTKWGGSDCVGKKVHLRISRREISISHFGAKDLALLKDSFIWYGLRGVTYLWHRCSQSLVWLEGAESERIVIKTFMACNNLFWLSSYSEFATLQFSVAYFADGPCWEPTRTIKQSGTNFQSPWQHRKTGGCIGQGTGLIYWWVFILYLVEQLEQKTTKNKKRGNLKYEICNFL